MSTGLIIAIVVVAALIVIAAAFIATRAGERGRMRKLEQRRQEVAGEHRQRAEGRERHAEAAEQRARLAEQEARRHRADAELEAERASAFERGMADDQLTPDDGERVEERGPVERTDGERATERPRR
jgi:hypothetical protein